MIEYTAKRSLANGHVANTRYQLLVEVMDATFDVRDVKSTERSAGGAMEVVFERQDVYWTVRLAPVSGLDRIEQLIEFLDSIESGETFRVWLRDTDTVPLVLKCEGEAGTIDAFMRCGARERDHFTAQFTALQAAPYDITGLQPGGGSGGFDGGDTAPIDPYDPDEGGLDEPPSAGEDQATIIAENVTVYVGAWPDDGFGSITESGVGDFILTLAADDLVESEFVLELLGASQPGVGAFTSVTINGVTLMEAAAFYTGAGTTPNHRVWRWTGTVGLAHGVAYTIDVVF